MARILMILPKFYQRQKSQLKYREDFSFSRLWPWSSYSSYRLRLYIVDGAILLEVVGALIARRKICADACAHDINKLKT